MSSLFYCKLKKKLALKNYYIYASIENLFGINGLLEEKSFNSLDLSVPCNGGNERYCSLPSIVHKGIGSNES